MGALLPGDEWTLRRLNGDRSRLGVGKFRPPAGASFTDGSVAECVARLGHTGGFIWRPDAYDVGQRVIELLNFDPED